MSREQTSITDFLITKRWPAKNSDILQLFFGFYCHCRAATLPDSLFQSNVANCMIKPMLTFCAPETEM